MADSVRMLGDAVRIVVRDTGIVAQVRKDRPVTMWGSTFEPNGRFRVDRLTVDYNDDDGDRESGYDRDRVLRAFTERKRRELN